MLWRCYGFIAGREDAHEHLSSSAPRGCNLPAQVFGRGIPFLPSFLDHFLLAHTAGNLRTILSDVRHLAVLPNRSVPTVWVVLWPWILHAQETTFSVYLFLRFVRVCYGWCIPVTFSDLGICGCRIRSAGGDVGINRDGQSHHRDSLLASVPRAKNLSSALPDNHAQFSCEARETATMNTRMPLFSATEIWKDLF